MKIYFCEKCGVSIPLKEVVGGRATAKDGKTYCQGCHPGTGETAGDLELYFCDNCRVSIPLQDVITNRAKAVGEQMLCAECARMTDAQRAERAEQIKQELLEKEENRYRLHFCDVCNTSIPQSHLITGRAVIRGGRTYCERCRGRAENRRVGVLTTIGIILLLGVVFVAGYVVFGAGRGLFGMEKKTARAGPDPLDVLGSRVADLEKTGRDWRARFNQIADKVSVLPSIQEAQDQLGGRVTANQHQASQLEKDQKALWARMKDEFERETTEIRQLEEKVARLSSLVKKLSERPVLPPATNENGGPVAKGAKGVAGNPASAPDVNRESPQRAAPPPIPADVKALLKELKSKDSGQRFEAAVKLGKKEHRNPASVDPLIDVVRHDGNLFVRRAAIRSLADLNAWKAVPTLIDALGDSEAFVAGEASEALASITGEDFGFDVAKHQSRSEVHRIVRKAKAWWKVHQGDRKK